MSKPSLLSALISALAGPEPEACIEAALAVLREHGLVVTPQPSAAPWLDLRVAGQTLTLAATSGTTPPDSATREQVRALLELGLQRANEFDDTRRLRERWDLLATASFEGIMIHVDGVIIELNDRICEMSGYSREELCSPEMLLRALAPEDLAEAQTRIRNRVEGEFLVTIVRKDGSRFRGEFHTKQSRLGDRPVRVVALRDVTRRERTAALLRESEARLRQILEATFDSVITLRDGIAVDVSGPSFFGRPRESVIGKTVLDMVVPSGRDLVAQRIQEGTAGSYETALFGPNDEVVPVEVISVNSTLNGEPVRVSGLRDLRAARKLEEQRRQLELQVERSQRLESLGVLASGIAHDFNNLLVGVLGGAELLTISLKDPEDLVLAESIRVAAENAASLTRQMLAYAGRRDVHAPELVDLSELCREMRSLLEAVLSKKAQIGLELAPDCLTMGERTTLMQVLMNLLTNASDALADKPGTIQISTQRVTQPDACWENALGATVRPGEWVMLQVRDTGVGMDAATQRRMFEPFFTTKPRGHGLGLGSCLGIVAAHGGALMVESAPGRGSTFSVLLPATSKHAQPRSASVKPLPQACRVLIIDDEPLVRAHLRRVLELRGFLVRDAANGRMGMAELATCPIDLVLLDLSMPDMDGVELAHQLRASGNTLPIVLCSGNLDGATERGLKPGMVQSVLQKPFSTEELLAAIDRAREPTARKLAMR
ncbi:MAG TPA: response regulator [Polyangiales bacterium]|nr:response regulator [Polyangiales bacterium]